MSKFFQKFHRGEVLQLVLVLIMALIAIFALVGAVAAIGDRTGAGYDGRVVGEGGDQIDCSGVTSLSAQYYEWVKTAAGIHLGGDEAALIALVQIESGWSPTASNGGKATGLGQFMPGTARGFKEFVGGNDKHGNDWPTGVVYDNSNGHSDDARFDPHRSIFGAAHYLSGQISRYGDLRSAYIEGYHGYCKDMSNPDCQSQKAEAEAGANRLMDYYNKLKQKGCTVIASNNTPQGAGCNNVPIFKQNDPRWANTSYDCSDGSTISSSGCGITAAAMVLKFYGKNVDPPMMAREAIASGNRACGNGTSRGFFPYIANKYSLKNENNITWARAMALLKQGKPIIVSGQGSAPFTASGHYIVLTCYNSDGTISVNDPFRANKNYPESVIRNSQHFISVIYQ